MCLSITMPRYLGMSPRSISSSSSTSKFSWRRFIMFWIADRSLLKMIQLSTYVRIIVSFLMNIQGFIYNCLNSNFLCWRPGNSIFHQLWVAFLNSYKFLFSLRTYFFSIYIWVSYASRKLHIYIFFQLMGRQEENL